MATHSVLEIWNGVGYFFPPWVMWPFWVFPPSFFCCWASSRPTVLLQTSLPIPVVSLLTLLRAGYDHPPPFIKRKSGLSSSSNGNSLACSSPGHLLARVVGSMAWKLVHAVPTLKMLPRPRALSFSSCPFKNFISRHICTVKLENIQFEGKNTWQPICFLVKDCCCELWVSSGFVTSGGEDFVLGSETRLDYLKLFV